MTIQELKNQKKKTGLTNQQISRISGIPLSTVQKIFTGETKNPRYETLQALRQALFSEESASLVAESMTTYGVPNKKQGDFTIEDYYAIPEDRRVELIDGVIYDMSAPTISHQELVGELFYQIKSFIRTQGGQCKPYLSPTDVQLDRNDRTMVQPDLIIVCNPAQLTDTCIVGAPDFILEVVSPSSRRRDYIIKTHKYMDAGTREYWIVDPYKETVLVYYFEDENSPIIYPMNTRIPVRIYEGKLELDFSEL